MGCEPQAENSWMMLLQSGVKKWTVPVGRFEKRRSERQSLRAKLRAGAQLQACANEFSDIDGLGLSSRIAELEEEERVIVGGSDVLKKLKEDHSAANEDWKQLKIKEMIYCSVLGG